MHSVLCFSWAFVCSDPLLLSGKKGSSRWIEREFSSIDKELMRDFCFVAFFLRSVWWFGD